MHRRARGLTLLELLVALAIVAVMMTLALPSFGSIVARHRLKAAAEQLSGDLGELRLLATQRGQALHLNLQPGAQWCYALATVSGCDCRVVQSCQLKTVRAADHPGVTLLAGADLLIDARNVGPLQDNAQALLQGSEGAQLRVGLTPLGRPKVCAPGGAVPGYPSC
jgi:type IV fimbrial biogenesis protein FimT